ncbi:hypothetical protein MXB_554 [Myxobolus squamalis]|nr:hypothetical protein MXB_554 [Myxobolus squamalis]
MNGRLHLGHAFSLSKCEFSVGYQLLRGKKCLFPFGLHCTGMPILAAADKLKSEISEYGFPPKFPESVESEFTKQWEVMEKMGLSDNEIKKFVDPYYWLEYFPPLGIEDLQKLGVKIDTRRSFITTDANPLYDSFVQWQFWHLKERKRLMFGKRHTIFSTKDSQPCMDHDRQSGEGVGLQEYTGIKLKLVDDRFKIFEQFKKFDIFLVASTLRPETLYGQTNLFVHPEHEYILFRSLNNELFVCGELASKNMAHQGFTSVHGSFQKLLSFKGSDIIGCKVLTPLSPYKYVFVYPMMSIVHNKGTGIVVSVPSDSPDDFAALNDLMTKPALRLKYHLDDEMILPFHEIPIIEVPGYGSAIAQSLCNELKISSQNDFNLLKEAKEKAYKLSFYSGTMLVGELKGEKVLTAKNKIRALLIDRNLAFSYMEPENTIISRSNDVCIVSLCDQWYISYDNEDWKKEVRVAFENMNTFSADVRNNFFATIDWLHEHACARLYGLGTKVPWDKQYHVESLSDSTIYMAYYTVAHLLQNGSLSGKGSSSLMSSAVWDYIFFENAPFPSDSGIDDALIIKMRHEFRYWYPVDLRVSGKDLVPNHLTYCVYNHVAIWPDEPKMWPKSFRVNGYLMLNSQKMSKSTGNFLSLRSAIDRFGADATRLCLADSGDTIEDANFVEKTAEAAILRLYNLIEWCQDIYSSDSLRTGAPDQWCDKIFLNEMNRAIVLTSSSFENMVFRDVIKNGFFDLQIARDWYKEISLQSINREVALKYIEV